MPIVEIVGLPRDFHNTLWLRDEIINKFVENKGINNVTRDEIMINNIESKPINDSILFIYVRLYIYKRQDRTTDILKSLSHNIGKTVFDFARKNFKNKIILEVLPVETLEESDCSVFFS